MIEVRAETALFTDIAHELVTSGKSFRFQARGRSMWPTIKDGEWLQVQPLRDESPKFGDVILFKHSTGLKAHRVLGKRGSAFVTRGDAGIDNDGLIPRGDILGRVIAKSSADDRLTSTTGLFFRLSFVVAETRRRLRHALRG